MLKNNKLFLLYLILLTLPSCTTVEVAANLGKKVLPIIKEKQEKTIIKPIYKVGNPYDVNGIKYFPKKSLSYNKTGIASWYGPKFHGKLTANGETFNQYAMTAAHKTLPMPSVVKVTNLKNNKFIIVRINDRGPFVNDRIIDLSSKAADEISLKNDGTGPVRVELLKSESILLEKLAKKGEFPEIKDLKKYNFPPINKPKNVDVKILNLNDKKIDQKQLKLEKKIKILELYEKKYKIWVQIASFSNSKSAKTLLKKFNDIKNINVYKAKVKGANFFRVRVGPYLSAEKAYSMYKYLIQKQMQGTRIVVEEKL